MALPMLVGGSDCGPSNPLQNLSKRFDQDRGIQQDHFGRQAGSSSQTFRTHQVPIQDVSQDAARFFGSSSGLAGAPQLAPNPFDLTLLRDSLPLPTPAQSPHPTFVGANSFSSWASDFLLQPQAPVQAGLGAQMSGVHVTTATEPIHEGTMNVSPGMQNSIQWNHAYSGYRSPVNFVPAMPPQAQGVQHDQMSWDKEFQSQESRLNQTDTINVETAPQTVDQQKQAPTDDLARTAGMLIDAVKEEQNPKFQKSEFMSLMRQLRDGEMVVEANAVVESGMQSAVLGGAVDVKGKGRVLEPFNSVQTSGFRENVEANAGAVRREDPNDAYFRQENEEFTKYWQGHYAGQPPKSEPRGEMQSWLEMQQSWDSFEATEAGIKPIINYQFQPNNPYVLGDSSRTRNHSVHLNQSERFYESVLELEAAVQRDPTNATAWFDLGVKQQENEREAKAIQALQRSLELDPTHLPSYLAISISYTNDSNRLGTHNAIKQWALRNDRYRGVVQQYMAQFPIARNVSNTELFNHLIQCLIAMARDVGQGGVDADVQVALAVLLNTTEDYAKAQDCFLTALAVRPGDWLLYNRVGATMANNGQAQEALQYYYSALDLNPAYIRARFNLGISCVNLRRYDEAAQHILDALVLQDSDGVKESEVGINDARGVTSSALWDSLKSTCLHMQRSDLAALCDVQDLNAFTEAFQR